MTHLVLTYLIVCSCAVCSCTSWATRRISLLRTPVRTVWM
jgi:hypothetical protein